MEEHEVIAGTFDGSIFYFDKDYVDPVLNYNVPEKTKITTMMVSHNGKCLAIGSEDGKIKLYKVLTNIDLLFKGS